MHMCCLAILEHKSAHTPSATSWPARPPETVPRARLAVQKAAQMLPVCKIPSIDTIHAQKCISLPSIIEEEAVRVISMLCVCGGKEASNQARAFFPRRTSRVHTTFGDHSSCQYVCLSPHFYSGDCPNAVQTWSKPGLNLVQTIGRSLFIRPIGQCPSTTGTSVLRHAVHTIPERLLIPSPDQRSVSVHYKGAIASAREWRPLEHLRGLEGPVCAADHNIRMPCIYVPAKCLTPHGLLWCTIA